MGQSGDQSIDFMQNKTLAESNINQVSVHLFEVFKDLGYTYIGTVKLSNKPYSETQPDKNGLDRIVFVFPLKLTSDEKPLLKKSEIRKLIGKTVERGMTLVPTRMHFREGRVKVVIGLAKGKKLYDKRETLRRREIDRETRKVIKERGR